MINLFKLMAVTATIMTVIFYYIVTQQHAQKLDMEHFKAEFDKNSYRRQLHFSHSKQESRELLEEKKKAEDRLVLIETRQAQAETDNEEFRKKFKDAVAEEGEREAKNKKEKKR